jgi:hypothetical protein
MDLEDKIAAIIKETYASTEFEDEGRSTAAAHEIILLLAQIMGLRDLEE